MAKECFYASANQVAVAAVHRWLATECGARTTEQPYTRTIGRIVHFHEDLEGPLLCPVHFNSADITVTAPFDQVAEMLSRAYGAPVLRTHSSEPIHPIPPEKFDVCTINELTKSSTASISDAIFRISALGGGRAFMTHFQLDGVKFCVHAILREDAFHVE